MQHLKYGYWRTEKPKEEGYSHEIISCHFDKIRPKPDLDSLQTLPFPGVDTILKAFERNVNLSPDAEFLGTRHDDKYKWLTFRQVRMNAFNFAAGAAKLGLIPDVNVDGQPWRFMGIQSKNRAEWVIIHLANMYNRCTTIALYDTLGIDASKFIIDQTEVSTICCSPDLVDKLIQLKANDDKLPAQTKKVHRLKNIVSFERIEDYGLNEVANLAGLRLLTLGDVIQAGIEAQETVGGYRPREVGTNDAFMLCYTSGTTGDPKGVILTHKMMINCVGAH